MDSIRILDSAIEWLTDIRLAMRTLGNLRKCGEDIRNIDGKAGYLEVSYRAEPGGEQPWVKGWYVAFMEMDSKYAAIAGQPPILCTWHRDLDKALDAFEREMSGRVDYHWRE